MSNYLETLVEKMVADGVSENDIKSVIEEVNSKKSPLHQDIGTATDTTGDEPENITLSGGDEGGVVVEESDGGDDETGNVEAGTSNIGVSDSTKTTNKSEDVSIYSDDDDEYEEAMSDKEKCEAEDGMCWDGDRKVCNRCIDVDEEVVEGTEKEEEKETDVKKTEVDAEIKKIKIGKSEEKKKTNEEVRLINEEISKEIEKYRQEINPATDELYTKHEASLKAQADYGLKTIDDQVYNPDAQTDNLNIAKILQKRVKKDKKNIVEHHNAQFMPKSSTEDLLNSRSDEILENNGDFTLFKSDFINNNGEEKIAVFPNVSVNPSSEYNLEEGVKEETNKTNYFNEASAAWDFMLKTENFITFDTQEEADAFIKLFTSERENYVAPWDYSAADSIETVSRIANFKGYLRPVAVDLKGNAEYLYFQGEYFTPEEYYDATVAEPYLNMALLEQQQEEVKKFINSLTIRESKGNQSWDVASEYALFRDGWISESDYLLIARSIQMQRQLSADAIIRNAKKLDGHNLEYLKESRVKGTFEYDLRTLRNLIAELLGGHGVQVKGKKDHLTRIRKLYDKLNPIKLSELKKGTEHLTSDTFVKPLELDAWIKKNHPKEHALIHKFIFEYADSGDVMSDISMYEWAEDVAAFFIGEGGKDLTPVDLKNIQKYFWGIKNNYPAGYYSEDDDGGAYDGDAELSFNAQGGGSMQAVLMVMDFAIQYKNFQFNALVAEKKDKYKQLLDATYDWSGVDRDGNIINIVVQGHDMVQDLEDGKALESKITDLVALNKEITTNNKKLAPLIGDLNKRIEGIKQDLLLELEEWTMPTYEGAGNLVLRTVEDINKEVSRVNKEFLNAKENLIKDFRSKNKQLIEEDEALRTDQEKLLGEEAKKLKERMRLYIHQKDKFLNGPLYDNLSILHAYTPILGDGGAIKGSLPRKIEIMQAQKIRTEQEFDAKAADIYEDNIVFDFLHHTLVGAALVRLAGTVGNLAALAVSDPLQERVATKIIGEIYKPQLDSDYGHFSTDEAEMYYNGKNYTVVSKKGRVMGLLLVGEEYYHRPSGETRRKDPMESTVYRNKDHAAAMIYAQEQVSNGSLDLKTEWSIGGLGSTVISEAAKMYLIMQATGGVGYLAQGITQSTALIYTAQGVFQGFAYGMQTYGEMKHHYLNLNPTDESGAETYAFLAGLTTALIAQINVEGRIGGKSFTKEMTEGIINKFLTGQVVGMERKAAIKYMSKQIWNMVRGETIEEWGEALIGEWLGKTWDQWKHGQEGGLQHNNVFVDMTPQDFLEMQILVTCTSGLMGGTMARSKLKGFTNADYKTMYASLAEILESDPTLKSLKQNLELAKPTEWGDGVTAMSEQQYKSAKDFIAEVEAAWGDNINKFKYTKPERNELLQALMMKKDLERTIEAVKDGDPKLEQYKEQLKAYDEYIDEIRNGLFFSKGYGGHTRDYSIKWSEFLAKKFPGKNKEEIEKEIERLREITTLDDSKTTHPNENKLFEELKKEEEKLLKEMDIELLAKAKAKAKADGKDSSDKGVLNRYKQLFIIEETWLNKIIREEQLHLAQVKANPVKWTNLLTRESDQVDKNTTEKEWEEIREACVTDRQKKLVSSAYNKIKASPELVFNLYWNGGNENPNLSAENSYNFNTRSANSPNGKAYDAGGRYKNNVADINMEHAQSNVVNHETAHHWLGSLENSNKEAHEKIKNTLIEYIKRNPNLQGYIKFGEAYGEKGQETIDDEMVVEFLADVIAGKQNAQINDVAKNGVVYTLRNIFKSIPGVGNDVSDMNFDEIMNLVADVCDGYSKGKLKYSGLVNPNNITTNGVKNNDHQSVNPKGKRKYILYDNNNNPIDVGAEINRLYKTDPRGAKDLNSKTFFKIQNLINLVLENESKKSRGDKGPFNKVPGFDLHGFQIAAIYGSNNKAYESIFQTIQKFDDMNTDFFGFIMTKGNKQGVFCPQMLQALESGDATNDFFTEELNEMTASDPLDVVQLPGEGEIDPNLIVTQDVEFDEETDITKQPILEALDLDQEIIIDGKPVKFQALLDDVILKIAGTKLPTYDQELTTNRLKTDPFLTAIFQQAGDKAGRLRLYVQLLMGKGGKAYKNYLIKHKELLIENLSTTYLSKNIPSVVEKYVVGEGWTKNWKGKKIARYTKADGPAWDGVTSGPPKIRTVKLEENQTWDDIISDDAFVALYMTEKNGKYSRIQSKGEGLEYQFAGTIGLQTFLDGIKDPNSAINKKFTDVSGLSDLIITETSIADITNKKKMLEVHDGKEARNILKFAGEPDKYDAIWENLPNIGSEIVKLGNTKVGEEGLEAIEMIVNDVLGKYVDPKDEGKPLFSDAERFGIAKDIWKLVERYNNASKDFGDNVTLPMFINNLLSTEALSQSLVKKYGIVDKNDKPIIISESFDDFNKVSTHRRLPLQMVNEMIAKKTKKNPNGGKLTKYEAVKLLLKYYKAQYASSGKIGRGDMIVYDKKTKDIKLVSTKKIKGNTPRYQVFENIDDFVQNVVNKIPGVKMKSDGTGTIDKVPIKKGDMDVSAVTQTVNSRRKATPQENLEYALEAQRALMLQLNWLADKIKNKESGYTKEDYVMLLMSLKSNMNTILRSAANLKYDIGEGYSGKVVYEHMIPAEIVCQILADHHLNIDTKITPEILEEFFKNYNVAIIPKTMDDMLKTFGLVASMPIDWDPSLDPIIRYYNELTIGDKRNAALINLEDNTVVGKEFADLAVLDIDQINSDIIELQIKSNPDLRLNSVVVINSKESINQKPFNAGTIRFFDFDETLTIDGKNVVYATDLNGKTKPMASSEFVKRAAELTEAGYTFDFKDFVNVRGGKEGPMLQKLRNQIERYGVKNIRILTARQPEAALAIHEWLKTKGINLPLDNIKGLGVEGKTIRGIDKAIELETYIADGYTDIEMYDDSKDVVDAINDLQAKYDVKIEGIQAVEDYKESINVINSKFLEILKAKKGIDPDNLPTALQAEINAAKQWNFSLFPPSSFAFRDFLYKFLPKGKEGEDALIWLDEMLTKPYQKGVSDWKTAKVKLAKRYKDLIKSLPKINKKLRDKIPGLTTEFTYDDAVRVYIWNKNGYKIPEITPEELQTLLDVVNGDAELKALALGVDKIALKNYPKPTQDWIAQNVASDMSKLANESRAKYLTEWNENIDLMFTEEVRNTLLNTYGKKFMAAFDDMLYAMEYGTSKPSTEGELSRQFRVWVNNSIGTIMFLNMRSAGLQTISMFNFIEMFGPNNIANASKAVIGSPKIFIKTALELLNSDYVQSRLGGDSRGVSEEEINKAIDIYSKKSLSGLIAYLLKIGFTPTKIADALAIVMGGAPFVMNYTAYYQTQVNPKTDDLYTLKEAETQAMLDFQAKAEESQQSSDPSQISQLQRSNLGILLMGFKNTPMQYARIMLRAADDIKNRRGNDAQNLGKIAYYGLLQNAFFVFLQQAVWAAIGDEDEEEATDDALNSMVDNIVSGLGLEGQIIVTVKNGVLEYQSQKVKGWNADHTYTILQFLNLSPSIGSKFRKLYSAIKTEQINRDVMQEMGLEPGNPGVDAIANLISAFTNIPLDRVSRKVNNLILASNNEYEAIDRIALTLGWNAWDLGIETEANIIRNRLKEEKKSDKEKEKELKDKIKTEEILQPIVEKEIEQYEKDKKDGVIEFDKDGYPANKTYYCSAANKNKKRCGAHVKKPGNKCEWHEDKDKDNVPDYKQNLQKKSTTQCEFIKNDNERCKNKATGDNGRCNVKQHQVGYQK